MSFLNELPVEKRDLVVSLPYRVGLWISQSDASGGSDSDAREQQALSSILHAYAEEVFGSETVQHIISGTISQQANWPRWGQNMNEVIVDCRHAVEVLSGVVDPKEVNAFKKHLVEIAESVALAFREVQPDMKLGLKVRLYLDYYKNKLKALRDKRTYKTFEEYLNISPGERRALITLAEALKTSYN